MNSSRNHSNRICKKRSQWLSLTLKDHSSTLLLVLLFAGTINGCLWVIVAVCGNVSAVRQDLWEDPSWFKMGPGRHGRSSRGLHTLAIFSTRWDENLPIPWWQLTPQPVVAPGLQTSPQHVPLPRVLRPHHEGHTFWHKLRTGHSEATLVQSRFVRSTVSRSQASKFSPRNSKHHTTVSKPFPTSIYCCLHLYLRSVTPGRKGAYNQCSGTISEIRARKSRLSPRCTAPAEPVKVSRGPLRLNHFFSKETFDMVAKDDQSDSEFYR